MSIDINVHQPEYHINSASYGKGNSPFVTFEIGGSDRGQVTCYIRSIEQAEKFAQGAIDLLENTRKTFGSNDV